MLISLICYQPLDIIWWFGIILVRAWAIVEAIVRSILGAIVRSRRGAIVGAGSRGEELPFSAVSHSLLLLHEAPLADHGDVRAATLNWVSQRLRKGEVGFEGAHQGSCPGTNCPSSIRWSQLPCRTCTRVSFEARIRSHLRWDTNHSSVSQLQLVLHIPAGGIFISASLLGWIWGRCHVEVQVELSWAGNSGPESGLNVDLNQTPFYLPSLIYC